MEAQNIPIALHQPHDDSRNTLCNATRQNPQSSMVLLRRFHLSLDGQQLWIVCQQDTNQKRASITIF